MKEKRFFLYISLIAAIITILVFLTGIENIGKLLGISKKTELKLKAVQSYEEIRAVEPLIKFLTDDNANVRESAIGALARIESEEAVEPVIQSLFDENDKVRRTAA